MDSEEVVLLLEKTWDFELKQSWDEINPDHAPIREKDRGWTGFSPSETKRIFAREGRYKVMLYKKFLRTESASIQEIDQLGRTRWVAEKHQSNRYAYIRVVFRGNQLLHYKVWPNMSEY